MNSNPDYEKIFKESNFVLPLFPEEENSKRFKSLSDLEEFIQYETFFWQNYKTGNLSKIYEIFQSLNNKLKAAINSPNIEQFKSNFNNFERSASNNNQMIVYSDSAIAKFIIELYKDDHQTADGAYQYFTHDNLSVNLSMKKHLKGILSAFTFENVDEVFLNKKKAEKLSFSQIRNRYQKTIDDIEKEYKDFTGAMNENNEAFQKSVTEWKDNTEKTFEENLTAKNKQFEEMKSQ